MAYTNSSGNNGSIDDALHEWNLARVAFAGALQTYLATFSHFEHVCAKHFESKEHDIARPSMRAAIDDEALSFSTHESSIISTRRRLLRLKNLSKAISPISILPVELLARILTFSVDSCRIRDTRPYRSALVVHQVNTISSVCSYWRRISLNTAQLWSYIDAESLHNVDHLHLWLDRAGSCPLNVANVARFDRPDLDAGRNSSFSLMLPRIEHVRSMILRSKTPPMELWLSKWYATGVPGTLTALALSTQWQGVEFPPPGANFNQERLTELFRSLDTLCLHEIEVNWDFLICHNLVTLSLQELSVSANTLRRILTDNPNLQYIHLVYLNITNVPSPSAVLPIQLHWLRTLVLEGSCSDDLLPMIAPGSCGLLLNLDCFDPVSPSETSRSNFTAFCRRSQLRELHCRSRYRLEDTIAAESKIEVLCFEHMEVDDSIYDIIVPPIDFRSRSTHQSNLPHLHSLYIIGGGLKDPEGFRRVVSTCPVREIGIDDLVTIGDKSLAEIDDFKAWVGPEIDVSYVVREKEMGYTAFTG